LRFLLDVHVAASIGRALAGEGHDVLRASDGHSTWDDEHLLQLAVEQDRVLVTEDRDFSELIFRDGAEAPRAVIYLRADPEEQPRLADRIVLILANTDIDHHMVVVRPTTLRLRPLPGSRARHG
jgi:predicted nuclease of predicted toxin-antitoxin system